MGQAVRVYLPEAKPVRGRIPCPIHRGTDRNFSYSDTGYTCFVCGAKGDVISFVKEVCELSTRADAMRRINRDFGLGLPIDSPASESFNEEAAKRRKEAERREAERKELFERRELLEDKWAELDRIIHDPLSDVETIAKAKLKIVFVENQIMELPE